MTTPGTLRRAMPCDSATIARHRGLMFVDMSSISQEEARQLSAIAERWLRPQIEAGSYLGWIVEEDGFAIASGGIHLRELGPVPGCLKVGLWAHIANIYVLPTHRRRGLARRLMNEMLAWCKENGADQVTLMASEDGRALYASLGFVATADMRLAEPRG